MPTPNLVGIAGVTGFMGMTGFVRLMGTTDFVCFMGVTGFVGPTGTASVPRRPILDDLFNLHVCHGLVSSPADHPWDFPLADLPGIRLIPFTGLALIGFIGAIGVPSADFIAFIAFVSLVSMSFMGFIGLVGFMGLAGFVGTLSGWSSSLVIKPLAQLPCFLFFSRRVAFRCLSLFGRPAVNKWRITWLPYGPCAPQAQ